jgi:hypothetical protein
VSYGLKLVGRAKVRSRAALPAEVQEAVLDLLEALAARAGPGDDEPSSQHVLLYRDGARVFKVFIATDTDHSGQILLVPSIWYIATV